MQLGQIQPKKGGSPSSKDDQVREAFEKGVRFPWMGLRPDLMLHKGAPDERGNVTYIIDDPVRGYHFEIGGAEAKLFLCMVTEKSLKEAVDKLMKTTSLRPSVKDVIFFANMLQRERLAILPEDADFDTPPPEPEPEPSEEEPEPEKGIFKKILLIPLVIIKLIFWLPKKIFQLLWKWIQFSREMAGLKQKSEKAKQLEEKNKGEETESWRPKVNIMFFRVPLARPDAFLNAIYPWVSPLWSKPFLYAYGVLGLMGLISVLQQWELYIHTTNYLFTFKGALTFMLCLLMLKVFHEFGHALAAKSQGIYVRRMGIYFMMLMPMLYTDASEGWKLPSKKGRLIIGAAGVLVELYVGALALFFWSVLPDGILRSVMFYTSGAAIISTLLMNISPFMRFDGYYVLADYLGISNLRSRSTLIFKHYYYKLLVGWKGPKPEENPWEKFMAVFGLGCNLYFAIVVGSISYMMYVMVDEMVAIWGGLITFLIYFAGPIIETSSYPFQKENHKHWGSRLGIVVRVVILVLSVGYVFMPMPKSEMIPAFFLFRDIAELETPGRGRVVTELPRKGAAVEKGDILMRIQDDNTDQELKRVQYSLAQVKASLKNMPAGGAEGGYRKWLFAEQQRLTAAGDKLRQSLIQLEIRSPISGQIMNVNKTLGKGAYVSKRSYVLTVADDRFSEVWAYVPEKLYLKLKGNEDAIASPQVIIPDLEAGIIEGKFREMLDFPATDFPNNSLFDYADGPIMTSASDAGGGGRGGMMPKRRPRSGYSSVEEQRTLQPKNPQYPIFFDIARSPGYLRHGTPCFVRIHTETISLAERFVQLMWRIFAKVRIV